ncbi:unnamed protein product [Brassicogethes aeneus]|uniref:Uncharacterized protein n=1 Tax=Brassicogethes aeneus TaxID=1431903 RepID=A0A9P0B9C7_BRAAE|nr:unnamed protein product [Brassicogethes aeneus]
MGKCFRKKKPKERWLLTRKTWRYMADAGKKIIPEGAQNRPEDIPKIEVYFQEVCKKEPTFLLWRKNSYPGALGLKKKWQNTNRGSHLKATSTDEFDKFEQSNSLLLESEKPENLKLNKMSDNFVTIPNRRRNLEHKNIDLDNINDLSNIEDDQELVYMLDTYLTISNEDEANINTINKKFNYQQLLQNLEKHLNGSSFYNTGQINFTGDSVENSLSETLNRYYFISPNRHKILSDLLTNRKALEKLYFDLKKVKGFRGTRGGTGYTSRYGCKPSGIKKLERNYDTKNENRYVSNNPPPVINIRNEPVETFFQSFGTQTMPILHNVLRLCEEEFKKILAEKDEDFILNKKSSRRRSSVDNDDVSQSVSDTIKRYLRMARKKSVDSDKADRFKRVNYDRNLRNIKAKGEITKPGDDDGLNKGCQTNQEWILTYRDLKFNEIFEISDVDSHISSTRSSIDLDVNEYIKSNPNSPPPQKSTNNSFLSNLLHGTNEKLSSSIYTARAMQKSKSSSSVMPGGKLTKKLFRSTPKSQTRNFKAECTWTPQVSFLFYNFNII